VRALLRSARGVTICDKCLAVVDDIIKDDDRSGLRRLASIAPDTDRFIASLPQLKFEDFPSLLYACEPREPTKKADVAHVAHVVCNFCDGADARIISGPTVFICSRCADACHTLLLRAGDSRVVEFAPMPVVDGTSESDSNAHPDTLSEEDRARLHDALTREVRRRYDALSLAMHVAHGLHNPVATDDSEDAPGSLDAGNLFADISAEAAESIARARCALLITGDSVLRRRAVARRIHEMSDLAGEHFIRIDCRVPGALAHIHDAGKGTLFLEEAGALTPQAQELLEIMLRSGEVPALESRVIYGGSTELESSIARAEFSEILALSLTHLRL
jgi:hypothetical protein